MSTEHVYEPLWVTTFDLDELNVPDNPDADVNDDEVDAAADRDERWMLGSK